MVNISSTMISSYTVCPRMCYEKIKIGHKTESTSIAMNLGHEVHEHIKNELDGNKTPNGSSELHAILDTPNPIIEGIHYYKYKKEVEYKDGYSECENQLLLEKEYPLVKPYTDRSALVYYNDPAIGDPIVLRDIFHKKMFGPSITHTEYEVQQERQGVNITGIIDAVIGKDGTIIDWKTSRCIPKGIVYDTVSYQDFQYLVQIGVYSILYNKAIKESLGVLGYIVKTKTPKFIPITYTLTTAFLGYVNNLIDTICTKVVNNERFEEHYGEHCDYCYYRGVCLKDTPEINSTNSIRTNYLIYNNLQVKQNSEENLVDKFSL